MNEEELDWDDDVTILNGTPYSGIGFLEYSDGSLKRKVTYRDGFEEGLCQEWYADGSLKREWVAERGRVKGELKEWHENGAVKCIGKYEFGVEIQYDEWNKSGDLMVHRTLEEGTALAEYLQQQRRAHQ
ncbi:MAG: hypothetical protein KDA79_03535 [Planctomycetaceae bacterium]|nr:hypothetical protein [Planctomycetaceae bacterium]